MDLSRRLALRLAQYDVYQFSTVSFAILCAISAISLTEKVGRGRNRCDLLEVSRLGGRHLGRASEHSSATLQESIQQIEETEWQTTRTWIQTN